MDETARDQGMTIQRYKRKQEHPEADQVAVKYQPGMDLTDAMVIARMASPEAEVTEVIFRSGKRILLAWYMHYPDDHPAAPKYVEVEAGDYLAYSPDIDLLYGASDRSWRQFYDEVTEEGQAPGHTGGT